MIYKVISGGQTGVDRAGLDAALTAGFPIGGYCPKGRRADDGLIPEQYLLIEIDSPEYKERTEKNVQVSDGTLNRGRTSFGFRGENENVSKQGDRVAGITGVFRQGLRSISRATTGLQGTRYYRNSRP